MTSPVGEDIVITLTWEKVIVMASSDQPIDVSLAFDEPILVTTTAEGVV